MLYRRKMNIKIKKKKTHIQTTKTICICISTSNSQCDGMYINNTTYLTAWKAPQTPSGGGIGYCLGMTSSSLSLIAIDAMVIGGGGGVAA